MGTYYPKTIDTSTVVLDDQLLKLTEMISENAHELWASQRINQGWKFGEKRNDDLKEHPCLIPYNQLPESEKEYDRITAMESIKLIVALGFKIIK